MSGEFRELLTPWLADPDPVKRAHARNRLALLDSGALPEPLDALVARVRRCPHWSPGTSCCGGWLCSLDPDEPRVVSIQADCAACDALPA